MRYAMIVVILSEAGLLAGCQTGSSTASAEDGIQEAADGVEVVSTTPIESQTATLVVHGMGCPLCASNVDLQLARVKGVEKVSVDMSSGRVEVALAEAPKSRPSRAALTQAIKDSGFTLVRIETP